MPLWWRRPATFRERLVIGLLGVTTVLAVIVCGVLVVLWYAGFSPNPTPSRPGSSEP